MAGLRGNTRGVGLDIVNYLTAVAEHFKITIIVTSGYRDASQQAQAMLKNWTKLKRGKVYSKKNLPEAEREKLDGFYQTSKKNPKAKLAARREARDSFLKLAAEQVGSKSKHSSGRAVDVTQDSVPPQAYRAIIQRLTEIREGRNDIYHFECEGKVPPVSAADEKGWDSLSSAPLTSWSNSGIKPTSPDISCRC